MPISSRSQFVSRSCTHHSIWPWGLPLQRCVFACFFPSGANPARPGAFPGANSPGPVADMYGPTSQESAVGNYISAASPQPGSGFSHGIAVSIIHITSHPTYKLSVLKVHAVPVRNVFYIWFIFLVFQSKFNCILMLKASIRGTFWPKNKFNPKLIQSAKTLVADFFFWSYLIKVQVIQVTKSSLFKVLWCNRVRRLG